MTDSPKPPRNFMIIVVVSAILGFSLAIYENVLPLYLADIDISRRAMGLIFGAGAFTMYIVRIYAGAWSDRVGRKVVYSSSLLIQGLAGVITPMTAGVGLQALLKGVREPSMRVRETMHSVLLYEHSHSGFIDAFGKSRGIEFLCMFFGLVIAAFGFGFLRQRGFSNPSAIFLTASGILALIAAAVFILGYREQGFVATPGSKITLKDIFRPTLNRELWIMTVAEFVFMIGLSCTHSFAMQLFFREKFGASDTAVLIIMALHRLSYAIPLLLAGRFIKSNLKQIYVSMVALEGIFIAVPGFINNLFWAAGIWLLHDFLGAGVWAPVQQALLQKYSDPSIRGKQVSLVLAIGSIGMILGPLMAGFLSNLHTTGVVTHETAISLPFIVGGMLVSCKALILSRL